MVKNYGKNDPKLGDVSSWTSSHAPLSPEELLPSTGLARSISRTLITERLSEKSACASVPISH